MKLIARGAEAEIYSCSYLGRAALLKARVPKKYRNRLLDERVRRERTKQECLLLHRAKELGIVTPFIYKVDRGAASITMEFIDGKRVKDILDEKNYCSICRAIGENIGRMHAANIIHGDLTTSNILRRGNELVFIDFSLGFNSSKQEDKAVDLLSFKKTYLATHYALEKGWGLVQEDYLKANPAGKAALGQIAKVEARARYW